MEKIQSIRGMNDILPKNIDAWRFVENVMSSVLNSYGYDEVRFPILEKTALFKRAIGEVTDIVEKEMYTFEDKGGDSVTLRPEGTACCVRLCEQHGLLYNQTQRLWYAGPMFRYERPQKGRMRQFHQFGVESFGFHGVDIEVEMILMAKKVFSGLGLDECVELQINSIGSSISRRQYRDVLVHYLEDHFNDLDADSQKRISTNPLRVFDSKVETTQTILKNAPSLADYLDDNSVRHFEVLKDALGRLGVGFTVNPGLVRGLDYYNDTVFEWVTSELGSQSAVCAGGRYDSLVESLGGNPCPAFGFAMGMERLVMLVEAAGSAAEAGCCDVFIAVGDDVSCEPMSVSEAIRTAFPALRVYTNFSRGSFKSQFKKADKIGSAVTVIVGSDEVKTGVLTVKDLRRGDGQMTISQDALIDYLGGYFANQLGK